MSNICDISQRGILCRQWMPRRIRRLYTVLYSAPLDILSFQANVFYALYVYFIFGDKIRIVYAYFTNRRNVQSNYSGVYTTLVSYGLMYIGVCLWRDGVCCMCIRASVSSNSFVIESWQLQQLLVYNIVCFTFFCIVSFTICLAHQPSPH